MVTKAYMLLVEKYKKQQEDKPFYDLKEQSSSYMEEQSDGRQNTKINKDNFNLEMFNKIYNENRLSTPDDDGYNNWIDKTAFDSEEAPKLFSDKFNLNVFNTVFDNEKQTDKHCNQVIEYKDPTPTYINQSLEFSELGQGKIGDFSGNSDSNKLEYTDYRKAHTNTKLINTSKFNRKEYKNVEDLEEERSNINYQMSEEDIARRNIQERLEEEQELDRRDRLKQNDFMYSQHYNKVNKLLIDKMK